MEVELCKQKFSCTFHNETFCDGLNTNAVHLFAYSKLNSMNRKLMKFRSISFVLKNLCSLCVWLSFYSMLFCWPFTLLSECGRARVRMLFSPFIARVFIQMKVDKECGLHVDIVTFLAMVPYRIRNSVFFFFVSFVVQNEPVLYWKQLNAQKLTDKKRNLKRKREKKCQNATGICLPWGHENNWNVHFS